jgi:hypothetical protein
VAAFGPRRNSMRSSVTLDAIDAPRRSHSAESPALGLRHGGAYALSSRWVLS